MKKNKKGFTLVELMAVIVVLIIVILIAMNKVRKSKMEAQNNAIKANTLSYIKAINDQAGLGVIGNKVFKSAIFSVKGAENNGIKMMGTKPDNALVCIKNYEVVNACLEYKDSKVTYKNGDIQSIKKGKCEYEKFECEITPTIAFEYTGSYQTYTAPRTGTYRIDLWGAQGGSTNNAAGGKGAYTSGVINLTEGDTLYIYVGGEGIARNNGEANGAIPGGWNGGAQGNKSRNDYQQANSSGGGATDVRLVSGTWNDPISLRSRIMVAGAGGGTYESYDSANVYVTGGYGGALAGGSGSYLTSRQGYSSINPKGGTQTTGGNGVNQWNYESYSNDYLGSFGAGGTGWDSYGGGGGGYYGGASGRWQPGAGGSSYISGYKGCVAVNSENESTPKSGCSNGTTSIECSYHYSGAKFTNTIMKSGNEEMPNYDNTSTMTGNEGNGYAVIYENYFLEEDPANAANNKVYAYSGHEETFTAPKSGTYKLEVWGAQGGSYNNIYYGGYGSYSIGYVSLNQGDTLYVNVGGKGSSDCVSVDCSGGYNGGGIGIHYTGDSSNHVSGGGGATSISKSTGIISSFDLNEDGIAQSEEITNLIIVAGGGGGSYYHNSGATYSSIGGHAGGASGKLECNGNTSYTCAGSGTQSSGGSAGSNGQSGSFGLGASSTTYSSGGGGGFYGGGSAHHIGTGGGSGYIGNSLLTKKAMYCYKCSESSEKNTKTISVKCAKEDAISKCAKKGNGYAKISLVK